MRTEPELRAAIATLKVVAKLHEEGSPARDAIAGEISGILFALSEEAGIEADGPGFIRNLDLARRAIAICEAEAAPTT